MFHNKQRISEPTNTLVLLCNAVPPERHEAVMKLVLNAKDGQVHRQQSLARAQGQAG